MTIKEVSEKYNISKDTLRWYEKIGLLQNINRKDNGIRDYNNENIKTVEFIICMRRAGVSVEVLQNYIKLYKLGDSTIDERKNLLIKQKKLLEEKKDELEETLERLEYKIDNYEKIIKKEA